MDIDLQINIYKVSLSPQSHKVSHLVSPQIMLYFLASVTVLLQNIPIWQICRQNINLVTAVRHIWSMSVRTEASPVLNN